MVDRVKRRKAFLGAIASLAGSVLSMQQQRRIQRQQQIEQNRRDTLQGAANLAQAYANSNDDITEKVSFKNGGKVTNDRIKRIKKISNRKVAEAGTKINYGELADGIGSIIGSIISISGNDKPTQSYVPMPTTDRLQQAKLGKRIYLK